jgi:hypothetical protein
VTNVKTVEEYKTVRLERELGRVCKQAGVSDIVEVLE